MFWCLHGENFQKRFKFSFFFFEHLLNKRLNIGIHIWELLQVPKHSFGRKTRFKYDLEYGIPTNYPKNLLINGS